MSCPNCGGRLEVRGKGLWCMKLYSEGGCRRIYKVAPAMFIKPYNPPTREER
jgi:hypothetical protein